MGGVGPMELIMLAVAGLLVCALPVALMVVVMLSLKKNRQPPAPEVPMSTCPDCNYAVSPLAAACPNCGRPLSPQLHS